jgi:phosphatidate cytidylyltransferase
MRSRNIIDAIGDTVPPSNPVKRWGLPVRVASALVLAPVAVAALYAGSPYIDGLVLVAAALAAWEWARLCAGSDPARRLGAAGGILIAAVVAASLAGSLGHFSVGGWLLATGAIGGALAAAQTHRGDPLWHAIGVVYLGAAILAFLWLRQDPLTGRAMVLWLIAVVWATDIGAYLAGRAIGGPRLAPGISPGKTWAGLAGGVAAAALAGAVTAVVLDNGAIAVMMLASGGLAVVAQVGDLFESQLKRRAGAKDSSALIPGHGGVLDRIDGLLAAALVLGGTIRLTGNWG